MDDERLRELLTKAKEGDEQAVCELYRDLIYPVLGKVAGLWESNPDTRADLVQDAAINVLRGLPKFRGKTVGEMQGFVWRTGKRVIIDHYRKNKPGGATETEDDKKAIEPVRNKTDEKSRKETRIIIRIDLDDIDQNTIQPLIDNDNPYDHAECDDLYGKVLDEFEKIRPDCLKSLTLMLIRCESIEELARMIDRSKGATRVHLHDCRKILKAIWQRLSG